ncbi:MAG: 30S ribosomal protein S20 [Alkalispirochaeta sp.]
MIVKGSAAKRFRQSEKRRIRNKAVRSEVRTSAKKVLAAVEKKDGAEAEKAFLAYIKLIDSAAQKGVYHKNTAGRKKSRMANKINALQA